MLTATENEIPAPPATRDLPTAVVTVRMFPQLHARIREIEQSDQKMLAEIAATLPPQDCPNLPASA